MQTKAQHAADSTLGRIAAARISARAAIRSTERAMRLRSLKWTEVADWSMTADQLSAESAQIVADVKAGMSPAVATYRAAARVGGTR